GNLLPGTGTPTPATITPGTLGFTGPLTLNGTLQQGLLGSGTTLAALGLTNVSGTLTLGGSSILDIVQSPLFNPTAGTTLTIMNFGALSGTFGSVQNATFNGGTEQWNVLYGVNGNTVQLIAANVRATPVAASWTTSSGNWTTATQWSCTPGPATCVPNNNVSNTYNVTLNSSGNTLSLNASSSPTNITISS